MRNVLVLTMPNQRNYNISTDPENKMNDYMAAYHDAVLFIGEVVRKIVKDRQLERRVDPFIAASLFRNTSFNGTAGTYRLDPQGDRDVTFYIIYTTLENKYKTLFTFDTATFEIVEMDSDPSFVWSKRLPNGTPDQGQVNFLPPIPTSTSDFHLQMEIYPLTFKHNV
uniref:Uncharacterized protein n=1 Tax=Knipowitschia caucasica TaxID=637954 RepID=A0AAV2M5V5_KNICA